MSLHKFADMVASKGRGDDSLLIHMTPDEVQRLQKFAEANGRSLTINPETGLPEAGMLSDLFKTIAPIALGAFLGPAGVAFGGPGLSAAMAGVATGGITALATGSLSRGLMAGLGAYGGAGLGESLMNAGTGAIAADATGVASGQMMSDTLAERGIFPTLEGGAVNPEYVTEANKAVSNAVSQGTNASTAAKASAGLGAIASNPMAYGSDLLKYGSAAAAPIMAGMMVPTTTKMPTGQTSPMQIKQKVWNGFGFDEVGSVDASKWGSKNFSDIYRGYDGGGIVALANGGVAHYDGSEGSIVGGDSGGINADVKAAIESAYANKDYSTVNDLITGSNITAADVGKTWSGFDTSGLAALGINLPGVGGGAPVVGGGGIDTLTGVGGGGAPVVDTVARDYWNEQAALRDAAANKANTDMWNKQNTDMWNKQNTDMWNKQNTDKWAQDALTPVKYTDAQLTSFFTDPKNKDVDITKAIKDFNADPAGVYKYIASLTSGYKGPKDATDINTTGTGTLGIYNQLVARGIDPTEYYNAAIKNDPNYKGWSLADVQRGYKVDEGIYKVGDAIKGTTADPKLGYDKEWVKFMDTNKYTALDMAKATGLSIKEINDRYNAVKAAEKLPPVVPPVVPPTNTSVVPTGPTGRPDGKTPGDVTTNPDGSVTVHPNIPGRPPGGFAGMGELRDVYTAGGGSLGYTSYAPKTIEEFNQLYNKQTGDSLAAYNYLMGKGANPVKSSVSQIARPYAEAVMGYPAAQNKKYNFVDGKYVLNRDYIAPGRDSSGNVVYGMSLTDINKALTNSPLSGQALYDWAQTNNLSAQQIADATGQSLSQVYAQFRAGQQAKKAADEQKAADDKAAAAANNQLDSSSTGGEAAGGLQTSYAMGGYAVGGGLGSLGSYSDGGRLLKGPGDGVSDSIPATIGAKQQPARLADGEFVVPARIVSELGNGSTDAGAKKLYAMMDRVQRARGKTTGKNKVAANSRADKYLPA